jgi:hypothetical protein
MHMRIPRLGAALLFASACQSAYADRDVAAPGYSPQIAIDVAPSKIRAPYDVQIVREDGQTLPTYGLKDRFYVQGVAGERYTILITNPTDRRIEAVVSVDGLDAVDGEAGDLRKRGYIVDPHGQVRVEGFRTSLADVATFRFSSVDGSYAGQKGKARNVGVIAVALFEENAPPPQDETLQLGGNGNYNYQDDLSEADQAKAPASEPRADRAEKKAPPSPPAHTPAPTTTATATGGGRAGDMNVRHKTEAIKDDDDAGADYDGNADAARHETNRPGLGTQYGENRYSAASYTRFVRAAQRPVAIAELRYNDAAGLTALGIPLQPMPDEYEIMTRETAQPFPGDRFAQPPR